MNGGEPPLLVAIDGPAASGKGTLGRRLAAHYGLAHLDTGLLYRAVAAALLSEGAPLDDETAAIAAARALDPTTFHDVTLKSHTVGEAASRVSVMPGLRAALLDFQRNFGRRPPGAVLDGRDIGTVVFPEAQVKIFVTATPQVRARRRAAELQAAGHAVEEASVLADIVRRDERDTHRAVAPLRPADDAHLLDTSGMDIETAFRAAVDLVDKAVVKRR